MLHKIRIGEVLLMYNESVKLVNNSYLKFKSSITGLLQKMGSRVSGIELKVLIFLSIKKE